MSIYKGKFKDIQDTEYSITIDAHMISSSDEEEITLGETPCVISSDSDGIFSPIKSRSCTIEILTKRWLFDLYSPTAKGVSVRVQKGLNTVFFGYLTPNSYNQSYTYIDNISLEAVDAVSVLKNFDYQPVNGEPSYQSLIGIINSLLKNAGYSGLLYVPNSLTGLNGATTNVINSLFLSEGNFFDDDDEHSAWKQYEVLEEMLRFLGWSLVPNGDDVYCLDYRYIAKTSSPTYSSYEIATGILANTSVSLSNTLNISKDTYASGEPSLSMDEVFNKIEVSDNLYEIEEIAPDIFEDNTHISITDEKNMGTNAGKWTTTTVKKHWLRPDEKTTTTTGYTYQTICRLKPSTNWKHHFYSMRSINESGTPQEVFNEDGMNYYEEAIGSQYTTGTINRYCNTHGCLIQHYAYRPNTGNIIPTSLDWEDMLTFFNTNDVINNNGTMNYNVLKKCELPVLEYEVPEEVMYKPSSGKSWITIKGSLFYQYNDAKFGDKNENTLKIVNENSKWYSTSPVEKATEIDEQKLIGVSKAYKDNSTHYYFGVFDLTNFLTQYGVEILPFGKGFSMWKLKVQLGDKYWNGSAWTTTESTFYLPFNNNPESDEDEEYMPAFGWASIVPNTDFTDKVGEQAYCIPIDSSISSHPSHGKLKITVYTPLSINKEFMDLADVLSQSGSGAPSSFKWLDVPPVIYCKDFEIGYVYTDSNVWYSQHNSNTTNSDDILYTNIINDDYVNDFSDIELKINTQQKDKPISRSYITTDATYVSNIKHTNGDSYKEQEKNIIDMYYEHYNSPKRIYECNIHGLINPYSVVYVASLGGKYIVDAQSFDVKYNNNTIKLIEY